MVQKATVLHTELWSRQESVREENLQVRPRVSELQMDGVDFLKDLLRKASWT